MHGRGDAKCLVNPAVVVVHERICNHSTLRALDVSSVLAGGSFEFSHVWPLGVCLSTKCQRIRSFTVFVPIAIADSYATGVFAAGAAGWPGCVRTGLLQIKRGNGSQVRRRGAIKTSLSTRLRLRNLGLRLCCRHGCLDRKFVRVKSTVRRVGRWGSGGHPAGDGYPLGVLADENSAYERTEHQSHGPDNSAQFATVRPVLVFHE